MKVNGYMVKKVTPYLARPESRPREWLTLPIALMGKRTQNQKTLRQKYGQSMQGETI